METHRSLALGDGNVTIIESVFNTWKGHSLPRILDRAGLSTRLTRLQPRAPNF